MEDLQKILIETEQRSKSNTHRLDKVEKKLEDYGSVVAGIQVLAQKQETMDGDLKEIKTDVKSLTEKPARRWESVVSTVVQAVLCGIVGYLLFKVGLGS